MECHFFDSITNIDSEHWNSLVGDNYPFMHYDFLHALEISGCVSTKTGWQPHHLVVSDGANIIAVMPLYLKFHSYGEYIFDFSWARAYENYGVAYYPKLLSAIPFAPASGVRLAHSTSVDQRELHACVTKALEAQVKDLNLSSIHILLPIKEESTQWHACEFTQKIGTQFHWFNNNYATFDEFLDAFNSRKRKAVKKERAAISAQGVDVELRIGTDISSDLWDIFFEFYRDTYQKRSGHNGYLNRAFFSSLSAAILAQTLVVFAKRGEHYIAGALYFFSDTTLYGRHWGCREEVEMLHFELCYYAGIDFCIQRGLQKFEAGAQGEHKVQRGFVPSQVYSNHWIVDPRFKLAINENILAESNANLHYMEDMKQFLPFKTI